MKSLIALALAVAFIAGCSSAPQSSPPSDHSWNADYATWGKDPVAGKLIPKNTAAAQSEYQGVTYYFQNQGEKQTFDANPAFYAKAAEGIASQPSSQHMMTQKMK